MTAIWNDNDVPLGYLITIRTYGTWLPGDERGSIDRYHNTYRGPRVDANAVLEEQHRKKLKSEPLILNGIQRTAVEDAIREVCDHRSWPLRAINVRTNHCHTVVTTGDRNPERALNAFKAYATRKLRERNLWNHAHSPWADKGSERWLWTEESIWYACDYVINGQGHDLRDFDEWGKNREKRGTE
jgi:REP element-mobilizing transposase RayT